MRAVRKAGMIAIAVALVASVGAGAVSGDPGAAGPASGCEEPTYVERLGPACETDLGWEVLLGDGSTVHTHGHDPAPRGSMEALTPDVHPDPPACVSDPSKHHNRLIYAYPQDVSSRYDEIVDELRLAIHQVNGFLREESRQEGHVLEYRFLCDGGQIQVDEVELPHDNADVSFWRVVFDLKDLGYDDTTAKYWILYDDRADVVNWGGTGTLHDDDRLVEDNRNNQGPDYGVTWGEIHPSTMMHENGHNLGAVQRSAPHFYENVGGRHCYDEADIMCYGANARRHDLPKETYCPVQVQFDCGKDDYFDPSPEPGEYLASHWNIGSPLNRFLDRRACSSHTSVHRAVYSCGMPAEASTSDDVDAHRASVSRDGDSSGTVAVSAHGDAHGTVAISGTGQSHGSVLAASGTGASRGTVAASGTNDSEQWGVRTCITETECVNNGAAASGTGRADGDVAASGTGDADAFLLAGSGTGDASGLAAVSGTGNASGGVPVSATGRCNDRECTNATASGDANGSLLALSGDGEANGGVVAVAGDGDASGLVALAGSGNASGAVAVAGGGDAGEGLVAVSGQGDAEGLVAASGTGDATSCTNGIFCVAISGTGHATGFWAASACNGIMLRGVFVPGSDLGVCT